MSSLAHELTQLYDVVASRWSALPQASSQKVLREKLYSTLKFVRNYKLKLVKPRQKDISGGRYPPNSSRAIECLVFRHGAKTLLVVGKPLLKANKRDFCLEMIQKFFLKNTGPD